MRPIGRVEHLTVEKANRDSASPPSSGRSGRILPSPTTKAAWLVIAALALIQVVFVLRLLDAAEQNSLTVDEPHYVARGLYLWESGDYHFRDSLRYHPPLAYHIGSLPLLFVDLGGETIDDRLGARLVRGEHAHFYRWITRLPFIALAAWGALLVFAWAREVGGREGGAQAGLLAACLFTCSPIVLAGAFVAHSDITVTVFFLQAAYAFWRWCRTSGWPWFVLCGASLGLALLSKLSAVLLLPGLGLLLLARHYEVWPFAVPAERPGLSPWPGLRATRDLALLGLLAAVVIWLGYGGSFRMMALEEGPLAGVPLPAIALSVAWDAAANASGRPIYFMGEVAAGERFWYLLPVVWLIKTPIPVLFLLILSCVPRFSNPSVDVRRFVAFTAVPLAVYLFAAVGVLRIPLGVRYLLPIIPLIHLVIATRLTPLVGARRIAVPLAMAWLVLEGAWVHPHYIAYFNQLIGGPANASKVVVGSDLDWGQDLGALARELESRDNPPVWLALAYGDLERPQSYGIRSKRLVGCTPVTGHLAVSAAVRRGWIRHGNPFKPPEPGCFDWLERYEPVATPGYSVFLYEIPAAAGDDGRSSDD